MGAGRMGDEGCVSPSTRVSGSEAFPTIEGTTQFFASPSVAYEKTRTPTRGWVGRRRLERARSPFPLAPRPTS